MSEPTFIPPRPPLLSFERRAMVYGTAAGLWLSGATWLLFHYFLTREGPFGPVPHPLEFGLLAAHGAFGFVALFVFGLLWGAHIPAGWRSLRKRRSGILMFGLLAWLVLSSYLLYYLGNDETVSALRIAHWAAGLAGPVPFLIHRFAAGRRGQSA